METAYKGVVYNTRHGGPFDRGSADSYYQRSISPHYYVGDTSFSERISTEQMTDEQIAEYMAGYDYNEQYGDKKDYS
jgi:hypothetical protein